MKFQRICLHGLVLTLVNLGSIILAFGVYQFFRSWNQIGVQGTIAAILSIVAFYVYTKRFSKTWCKISGIKELVGVYVMAFVWCPVVFIPLHYINRGYLTSFSNILATWFFQIPVNFLALFLVYKFVFSKHESVEIGI